MHRTTALVVLVFSLSMATSWSEPAATGDDIRPIVVPNRVGMSNVLELAQPVQNMDVAGVQEGVPTARRRITRADYTHEEVQEMASLKRWMVAGYIVGGVSVWLMVGEYGFTGSIDNTRLAVVPALIGVADVITCHTRRGAIKKRVRQRVSVDAGLLLGPGNRRQESAVNQEGEFGGTGVYAQLTCRW